MAQTSTQKLLLETHVKVLNKDVDRHMDCQKDTEGPVILVERAQEIKQKVKKVMSWSRP